MKEVVPDSIPKLRHLNTILHAIRNVNQLIFTEKNRTQLIRKTCNLLIEAEGFLNSWIVLFDSNGTYLDAAQAGLPDQDFNALNKRLKAGVRDFCIQQALEQQGVVSIGDPLNSCKNCPLCHNYAERGGLAVCLRHEEKVYGTLTVSVDQDFIDNLEEHNLFIEVAHDIAFKLHTLEMEDECKQAEQTLRENEECYRGVVEDTPVLICRFLPNGKITFVNKYYCEYFDKTPEELIGSSFLSLIPESDRETVMANISALTVESPTQSHEHPVIGPDGKICWQRWTNRVLFDTQGKAVAYQSIGEDITEQREAEKRIKEHESQLKSLASELSLAEERERRRIAAGIHDDIAQKLAMAKFELQSLQASITNTDVSGSLKRQCQLMDQVVADARSLTFELSNPVLYQVGLEAAVESYLAERIQGQFGIKCKFKSEGPQSSLEEDVRVVLFQAVRELLANVVKHANASTVEVYISNTKDDLRIVVQDDGVGFDPTEIGPHPSGRGGFGLFNIRERLEYLGGNVKIESRRKNGARITMTVAIRMDAAAE